MAQHSWKANYFNIAEQSWEYNLPLINSVRIWTIASVNNSTHTITVNLLIGKTCSWLTGTIYISEKPYTISSVTNSTTIVLSSSTWISNNDKVEIDPDYNSKAVMFDNIDGSTWSNQSTNNAGTIQSIVSNNADSTLNHIIITPRSGVSVSDFTDNNAYVYIPYWNNAIYSRIWVIETSGSNIKLSITWTKRAVITSVTNASNFTIQKISEKNIDNSQNFIINWERIDINTINGAWVVSLASPMNVTPSVWDFLYDWANVYSLLEIWSKVIIWTGMFLSIWNYLVLKNSSVIWSFPRGWEDNNKIRMCIIMWNIYINNTSNKGRNGCIISWNNSWTSAHMLTACYWANILNDVRGDNDQFIWIFNNSRYIIWDNVWLIASIFRVMAPWQIINSILDFKNAKGSLELHTWTTNFKWSDFYNAYDGIINYSTWQTTNIKWLTFFGKIDRLAFTNNGKIAYFNLKFNKVVATEAQIKSKKFVCLSNTNSRHTVFWKEQKIQYTTTWGALINWIVTQYRSLKNNINDQTITWNVDKEILAFRTNEVQTNWSGSVFTNFIHYFDSTQPLIKQVTKYWCKRKIFIFNDYDSLTEIDGNIELVGDERVVEKTEATVNAYTWFSINYNTKTITVNVDWSANNVKTLDRLCDKAIHNLYTTQFNIAEYITKVWNILDFWDWNLTFTWWSSSSRISFDKWTVYTRLRTTWTITYWQYVDLKVTGWQDSTKYQLVLHGNIPQYCGYGIWERSWGGAWSNRTYKNTDWANAPDSIYSYLTKNKQTYIIVAWYNIQLFERNISSNSWSDNYTINYTATLHDFNWLTPGATMLSEDTGWTLPITNRYTSENFIYNSNTVVANYGITVTRNLTLERMYWYLNFMARKQNALEEIRDGQYLKEISIVWTKLSLWSGSLRINWGVTVSATTLKTLETTTQVLNSWTLTIQWYKDMKGTSWTVVFEWLNSTKKTKVLIRQKIWNWSRSDYSDVSFVYMDLAIWVSSVAFSMTVWTTYRVILKQFGSLFGAKEFTVTWPLSEKVSVIQNANIDTTLSTINTDITNWNLTFTSSNNTFTCKNTDTSTANYHNLIDKVLSTEQWVRNYAKYLEAWKWPIQQNPSYATNSYYLSSVLDGQSVVTRIDNSWFVFSKHSSVSANMTVRVWPLYNPNSTNNAWRLSSYAWIAVAEPQIVNNIVWLELLSNNVAQILASTDKLTYTDKWSSNTPRYLLKADTINIEWNDATNSIASTVNNTALPTSWIVAGSITQKINSIENNTKEIKDNLFTILTLSSVNLSSNPRKIIVTNNNIEWVVNNALDGDKLIFKDTAWKLYKRVIKKTTVNGNNIEFELIAFPSSITTSNTITNIVLYESTWWGMTNEDKTKLSSILNNTDLLTQLDFEETFNYVSSSWNNLVVTGAEKTVINAYKDRTIVTRNTNGSNREVFKIESSSYSNPNTTLVLDRDASWITNWNVYLKIWGGWWIDNATAIKINSILSNVNIIKNLDNEETFIFVSLTWKDLIVSWTKNTITNAYKERVCVLVSWNRIEPVNIENSSYNSTTRQTTLKIRENITWFSSWNVYLKVGIWAWFNSWDRIVLKSAADWARKSGSITN